MLACAAKELALSDVDPLGSIGSQFEFLSIGAIVTLTPRVVLARLKLAAQIKAGFIFSVHACIRADQRSVTRQDVINVFVTARQAEAQDNGNWRIKGLDDDGEELT